MKVLILAILVCSVRAEYSDDTYEYPSSSSVSENFYNDQEYDSTDGEYTDDISDTNSDDMEIPEWKPIDVQSRTAIVAAKYGVMKINMNKHKFGKVEFKEVLKASVLDIKRRHMYNVREVIVVTSVQNQSLFKCSFVVSFVKGHPTPTDFYYYNCVQIDDVTDDRGSRKWGPIKTDSRLAKHAAKYGIMKINKKHPQDGDLEVKKINGAEMKKILKLRKFLVRENVTAVSNKKQLFNCSFVVGYYLNTMRVVSFKYKGCVPLENPQADWHSIDVESSPALIVAENGILKINQEYQEFNNLKINKIEKAERKDISQSKYYLVREEVSAINSKSEIYTCNFTLSYNPNDESTKNFQYQGCVSKRNNEESKLSCNISVTRNSNGPPYNVTGVCN